MSEPPKGDACDKSLIYDNFTATMMWFNGEYNERTVGLTTHATTVSLDVLESIRLLLGT